MNLSVDYTTRDRIRSVALTTAFDLASIAVAADRLRSWAMIRSAPIAGAPFLRLGSQGMCRVHLPILAEGMPHPETGIELDAAPSGNFAQIAGIAFGEVQNVGRALREALADNDPTYWLEFHSVNGDFFEGNVGLPFARTGGELPETVSVQAATVPTSGTTAAEPVRVVTIARQHGAGGEAIAKAVARQLGVRLVDYDIFSRAAEQAGVPADLVEGAAVHQGLVSRILDQFARTAGASGEIWMPPIPLRLTPLYTSSQYRAFVEDAIRELAEEGNVLILGHGAQLVLAGRPDTLRILVTAGSEYRIARAMADGLGRDEAQKILEEADAERVDYFREFYNRGWLDPAAYDLVINTDRTSVNDAAGIVLDTVRRRAAGRSAMPARTAARDTASLSAVT